MLKVLDRDFFETKSKNGLSISPRFTKLSYIDSKLSVDNDNSVLKLAIMFLTLWTTIINK